MRRSKRLFLVERKYFSGDCREVGQIKQACSEWPNQGGQVFSEEVSDSGSDTYLWQDHPLQIRCVGPSKEWSHQARSTLITADQNSKHAQLVAPPYHSCGFEPGGQNTCSCEFIFSAYSCSPLAGHAESFWNCDSEARAERELMTPLLGVQRLDKWCAKVYSESRLFYFQHTQSTSVNLSPWPLIKAKQRSKGPGNAKASIFRAGPLGPSWWA